MSNSSINAKIKGNSLENKNLSALGERKALYLSRILGWCLIVSLTVNCALAFSFSALLPLKEVRPYLVNLAEEKNVVSLIRPITDEMKASALLSESLIRQYINFRFSFVPSEAEMKRRWGLNGYMEINSTEDEYERFLREVTSVYQSAKKQGYQRDVEILNVTQLNDLGIFSFEIKTRLYTRAKNDKGMPLKNIVKYYNGSVEVKYEEKELTHEQALLSPTGFTVVNFNFSEKNIKDK